MTLIHQETPTHLICAVASRPPMFLTSDVCSRYGLEAMGQARYGPVGTAAAAWEKEPPSHPKVAKDMRPVESESTYWHQGHKNPLKCVIFKAHSCCVTGSAQEAVPEAVSSTRRGGSFFNGSY